MSQTISNNVQDGSAVPDKSQSSGPTDKVAGPKGVAIGAAVGGGPGAAIGSLADKGSANKDAEKISKQVEESGNHPKHGSATKGMTDPTAQ